MLKKENSCYLNVFMIIRFKIFYDRLNIVLILAPGYELFSVKCTQFSLTFSKNH